MKKIFLASLAGFCALTVCGYTFEENTALQHQDYIRKNINSKRRAELREWFKAKRPARPMPAEKDLTGFTGGNISFAVDKSFGYPAKLTINGSENLLANHSAIYPFFEIYLADKENKRHSFGNYGRKPVIKLLPENKGLSMTWKLGVATVITTVTAAPDNMVKFDISVTGVKPEYRLVQVDYPMLAVRPRGETATNKVVLQDRRGRLRNLTDITNPAYKEYPCSNARFQMTAIYDDASKKGVYFAADDTNGWEKVFWHYFLPEYDMDFFHLTRYPLNRGKAGNSLEQSFSVVLTAFDGDWYDAAQIYRKWTLLQPWAKNGPLHLNKEIPEYVKRSPVWLRFYLRESRGVRPEHVVEMSKAWAEFLPGKKMVAELFHYSNFKEPGFKSKYPVSEYYGYKAPAFPGLPEALKNIYDMGIRCCVFLQSEIINQFNPENDALKPAYKLDAAGKPRFYLNERSYVCRMSPVWQQRTTELVNHMLDIGFVGVYLDTFAKSTPDFECHADNHGHPAGGGNTDVMSQRAYGKMIRQLGRAANPEFFMVGEACTEPYMDILDVKENATHTDPDAIFLERTIYGEYYLPHGRTISNSDVSYTKFLGLDFLNGMIPGRFFNAPPQDPHRRKVLLDVINHTDSGYYYLRCGQMLRQLKFAANENVTVTEMNNKIPVARWQNTVFRSAKDNSVAIYVFHFGDKAGENTLLLPDGSEWQANAESKVFQAGADGKRQLLGTLGELRQLQLKLEPDGIAAFIIEP